MEIQDQQLVRRGLLVVGYRGRPLETMVLALLNWLQDQYDNRDVDEPLITYYGFLHLVDD